MLTRFALPALAAAAALIATAPLTHDAAEARPSRPPPPTDPSGGYYGGGALERLRSENAALRAELGQYQTAVADGLAQLEQIARTSRDRRTVMRLRRAIDGLRYALTAPDDGWDDDGWSTPPGAPPPGGWPRPPNPQPWPTDPGSGAMTGADFQQLTAHVAAARFPSDQLNVIGAAAPRNRFTVDQVIALMQVMSFDDHRIEIAVLLAPRVVDGQRWYLVEGALQFASSRDALRQRVTSP